MWLVPYGSREQLARHAAAFKLQCTATDTFSSCTCTCTCPVNDGLIFASLPELVQTGSQTYSIHDLVR